MVERVVQHNALKSISLRLSCSPHPIPLSLSHPPVDGASVRSALCSLVRDRLVERVGQPEPSVPGRDMAATAAEGGATLKASRSRQVSAVEALVPPSGWPVVAPCAVIHRLSIGLRLMLHRRQPDLSGNLPVGSDCVSLMLEHAIEHHAVLTQAERHVNLSEPRVAGRDVAGAAEGGVTLKASRSTRVVTRNCA